MISRCWIRLGLRSLTGLMLVGLVSCGGGGGGGGGGGDGSTPPPTTNVTGNGFAPASGPGDTSSYFPVGTQDRWDFDYTTNDPSAPAPTGSASIEVTGTKTVQGVAATVFTHTDASVSGSFDQYFSLSNGGVTALGNTDSGDSISPLIIPYVQLLFPVGIGQVSNVVAQNLAFGSDTSGKPITLDLTQTISNAAMESVDVPAGTFASALRQTTIIAATAHDGSQSTAVAGNDTTWYVAGVGEVKDQTNVTGPGTSVTSSNELRRYFVNGKWHGIGLNSLDYTLVTTGCAGSSAPAPAVTSDGTNFLIVAYACTDASGTALSNWEGVLAGPDGTVLNTFNITPPAAVSGTQPFLHAVAGFDGTHYLVVYEDVSASFNTVPLQSIVLGTDGSVVSGPTMVGTGLTPADNSTSDREALGFDGTRFLLIYADGASPPGTLSQMSGMFLTAATGQAAGSVFTISQVQGGAHESPAISWDGTNYLVVWADSGTSPQGLHGMRISAAGVLLDATPFALVDLSTAVLIDGCCDLEPTVAFDGTNYLVAYRDPRGTSGVSGLNHASISAVRVSKAGVLLDGTSTTAGIVVAQTKDLPRGRVRAVFTGGVYWLVWEVSLAGSPQQLNATRVTTAGVVSTNWPDGFMIAPAVYMTELPAFANSAQGPLLVWLHREPTAPMAELMGLRIYPTGP